MKRSIRTLLVLSISFSNLLYAAKPLEPIPQDFLYNNKPIDPLCIFESKAEKTIPLTECGINAQPNRQVISQESALATKGFIGYEYSWPFEQNNGLANCYSYYKLIGTSNGWHIVYALNNSGGSGQFSGIYLVKRQNDLITVKYLAGGDRCNNGINSVKMQSNKVLFNANLTAIDFINLSQEKSPNNYQKLASCAACCIATANFEIMPMQGSAKLISIEFERNIENIEAYNTAQHCFNNLLIEYINRGYHSLNPTELNQFTTELNDKCLN